MRRLLLVGLLLILVALSAAFLFAQDAPTDPEELLTARGVHVQPLEVVTESAVQILDIGSDSARLNFIGTVPLACTVVYGTTTDFGSASIDQNMNGGAIVEHNPIMINLEPDTEYFYRVEVDGDVSERVRSVRTAPTPEQPTPLRIALGSCSRLLPQPIFTPILAAQPDLFLFVGDNNYANTRFRAALRWNYQRFRRLRERADLLAGTPTLAIWDDHDFLANNSNGTCPGRDEALAAFREYWANPAYGLPDAPGVFFRHRWGATELFMLDCRMYRPDVGDAGRTCTPEPDPPALPISGGPLGPDQEAWLFDALGASDATFKLVACGSRFTPAGSLDSWASFPEARARLLQALEDDAIGGVVFLSGDIHRSLFSLVPGVAYSVPEIVSSPLATARSSCNPNAPGQLTCYDASDSFVVLDIDPT
ncbi:MAG: alkaline phosphatase D family protein, partial [Myxococcales bacterium]|nr:alkaline phosphatase D family protein [Myxococcales bacterium]